MSELELIIDSLMQTISPGNLPDDTLLSLNMLFSQLLVAALDLIDMGSVSRWRTPWGREEYTVKGVSDTYNVVLNIPRPRSYIGLDPNIDSTLSGLLSPPAFCTCPAFAYTVLLPGSSDVSVTGSTGIGGSAPHMMCKHILAVRIAQRLDKCVEKPLEGDGIDIFATNATS